MNNGDMPASPIFNDDGQCTPELAGFTKRERFAMVAMQAMIGVEYGAKVSATQWAKDAIECADALLAELAKEQSE